MHKQTYVVEIPFSNKNFSYCKNWKRTCFFSFPVIEIWAENTGAEIIKSPPDR